MSIKNKFNKLNLCGVGMNVRGGLSGDGSLLVHLHRLQD